MWNRPFIQLWLVQFFSSMGDWVLRMSLVYFIYRLTGKDPQAVAMVTISEYAPVFLFAMLAGVFVDRWNRKKMLAFSNLARALFTLCLFITYFWASTWIVYGVAFFTAIGSLFTRPSVMALIPLLVSKENLPRANGFIQTNDNAFIILGPLLASAIFYWLGAYASFLLVMLSFLGAFLIAMMLPTEEEKMREWETSSDASFKTWARQMVRDMTGELREGIRFVSQENTLKVLLLTGSILGLGGGALNVLSVVYVTREMGLRAENLAWFTSSQGIAMLSLSILVASLKRNLHPLHMVTLGLLLLSGGIFGIAGFESLWAVLGCFFVLGIGNALANIGMVTLVQLKTEDRMRGRVNSLYHPAMMAGMLISAGLTGFLTEFLSIRTIFAGAAVIIMFSSLPGIWLRVMEKKQITGTAGG
ncbi:MAG: MFS transporter [Bacillaceae bacterium]|nr:MFS transporter [Bacillaceae bacterium]